MSKKVIVIISGLIAIIIALVIAVITLLPDKEVEKFYLNENYYERDEIKELSLKEFNTKINNKESFVVFVYQPLCATSSNFEEVLQEFTHETNMIYDKISFQNIKKSKNVKFLEYYPSFIIYNEGEMVDYLKADSDDDTECYQSLEKFENWLFKYVERKETTSSYNKPTSETTTTTTAEVTEEAIVNTSLDEIKKDKNKVNIYLFWGQGCPHCKNLKAYLSEIEDEYGKYYNLYQFEVFGNVDNYNLLMRFADELGDDVTGVPYMVVGDTSLSGFTKEVEENLLKLIKEKYNSDKDIYFDKIK